MKNKKGFTLVEIMAVIVVMGIIALIAVPIYNNTSTKVKQKEYENVIAAIEVASERYAEKTSKIRFSVQELVDRGEYEADNEQGDVLSPIDKKVLNCYIINVDYEDENYNATFTDENDCNVASGLKDTFGVTIAAVDESGSKWTNATTKWTKYNVTLTANINEAGLPSELKGKRYTAEYDWFAGNVKVSDTNSNTYKVEAQTILNAIYQVRVTIHTEEKDYTATANIKVQIDKQAPLIYEVSVDKANEWIKAGSKKDADIKADDYNGSGIKGYYIGRGTTCPTTEGSYKKDYTKGQGNGTYIACVMDNVGNISEAKGFKIEKVDSALPTVTFKASDNITSGEMHQGSFTLNLIANTTGYTGSEIVYKYGTDRNNVETVGSSIRLAPPATTQTYYGKICNATACSSIIEYKAVLDEEPPAPTITASDGIKSGNWHKKNFNLKFSADTTNYHGSNITYNYRYGNSSDNGSEVNVTAYGTTTYWAKACNQSGLCSKEVKYEAKLDSIPTRPIITASDGLPSGSFHPEEFTLHFQSTTESGSKISYYYGTWEEAVYFRKTGNDIKFTPENLNQVIYVFAWSEGGLLSNLSYGYIVNPDNIGPKITMTYEHDSKDDFYPITLKITLTDNESGLQDYVYYESNDNRDWEKIDGQPKSKTITKKIKSQGYYCVKARDMAGNYSKEECIDLRGPLFVKGVQFHERCDGNDHGMPGYTSLIWIDFEIDGDVNLKDDGFYYDWKYDYDYSNDYNNPPGYFMFDTNSLGYNWGGGILVDCFRDVYVWVKAYDKDGNYTLAVSDRTILKCGQYCSSQSKPKKIDPCSIKNSNYPCGNYKTDICKMYANSIMWWKIENNSDYSDTLKKQKQKLCTSQNIAIGNKYGWNLEDNQTNWYANGNNLYTHCGLTEAMYWADDDNIDLSKATCSP